MTVYKRNAVILKALGDPTRLEIIAMLSGGTLCACHILERFRITQPTLSHHMRILCDCKLVNARKEGKWMHYSLNKATLSSLRASLVELTATKESGTRNEKHLEDY